MESKTQVNIVWGGAAFIALGVLLELRVRGGAIAWEEVWLALGAGGLIPIAVYLPVWYSAVGVSWIQFASGFHFVTVHPVLFFLSWIPVVAVLRFREKKLLTLAIALVLIGINSIASENGEWKFDLNSALAMAVYVGVLLASFELVMSLSSARKRQEERSVKVAESLHTQVAGSLTKVLLALEDSPDYFASTVARKIAASDIRNALLSTRQLLEILKGTHENEPPVHSTEYFSDALDMLVQELEECHFTVIEMPSGRSRIKLNSDLQAVIASIFAEIGNNLLKYADSNRPIVLTVVSLGSYIQVELINSLRVEMLDSMTSSGMGLSIMKNMVTSIGGQVQSSLESPGKWRTTLLIPLEEK